MSTLPASIGLLPGGLRPTGSNPRAASDAADVSGDPFVALFAEIRAAGLVPGANGVETPRAAADAEDAATTVDAASAAPTPFDAIVAMLAGLVAGGGPENFPPRFVAKTADASSGRGADAPLAATGARTEAANPGATPAGAAPAGATLAAATPATDLAAAADAFRAPETPLPEGAARPEAAHASFHAIAAAHARPAEPQVPVAPPIAVPLHDPRWGAEVADRVQWIASQQLEEARIHVTPPELGPIDVHIAIDDGRATIHLAAQVESTRAALESHLHGLAESLSQSGLSLAGAFVSQENPREPRGEPGFASGEGARSEETSPASLPQRLRLGLVDDFA